jgi:hypothetical protein
MSDDILTRAEKIANLVAVHGSAVIGNQRVIEDLIAEVKRLRDTSKIEIEYTNKYIRRLHEAEEQLAANDICISRLEEAYLKTEAEYLWQNSDPGYEFDKCEEMARESLERIKGGEQA